MDGSGHARGYWAVTVFFLLMLAAAVAVDVAFLKRAPDRVPGHFTGGGDIDNWISRDRTLIYVAIVEFAVPILFAVRWKWSGLVGLSGAKTARGDDAVQYWLHRGDPSQYTDYMTIMMRQIGAWVSGLGSAITIIILHAALADNPSSATPVWVFPVLLVVFLAAVAASCWPLRLLYRVIPWRDHGHVQGAARPTTERADGG